MVAATNDEALLDAQALVLLVDCDPPPRGCGAPIGTSCTSTSPRLAGKSLGRQVAHPGRLRRAGVLLPDDVTRRCRQTALPVDECAHCRRWAELTASRPQRLGLPSVSMFSGRCTHCDRPWPAGAPIVRVVGGRYAHLDCSVAPPDDESTD